LATKGVNSVQLSTPTIAGPDLLSSTYETIPSEPSSIVPVVRLDASSIYSKWVQIQREIALCGWITTQKTIVAHHFALRTVKNYPLSLTAHTPVLDPPTPPSWSLHPSMGANEQTSVQATRNLKTLYSPSSSCIADKPAGGPLGRRNIHKCGKNPGKSGIY
jgi:hypothetical protein